jgi:FlaA1/EpsC-like NDP-sugar epimerase
MKVQNYSNHRRYLFTYHFLTFLIILVLLISSIYYSISMFLSHQSMKIWLFFVFNSLVLISLFFHSRMFSLKAQDRAIRAEENFRHYILTGKPLDSRLTTRQIIGLRFASDEEFPALAVRAVEENLSEDEIKRLVKKWRPDYYRV